MDFCFGVAGLRVELHGVGFDAHDGAGVCGEEYMGNLGHHGVGEVLDHEGHAVCFGPAEGEEGAGLGFAGFQGDAGPAQGAAEADEAPVMGGFVHE